MVTKAPNDDSRGMPAPDSGRNDPALGEDDTGSPNSDTAEGNPYSPNFEPKPAPKPPASERDADIDTDGG